MHDSEDSSKRNLPTNWFELVIYLISTKHGLRLIGYLIAIIAIIFLILIYIMRPAQLDIQTNAGTITIKKGSTQNAVLMLSASGSRENEKSPWSRTGIMVKKGDKIKVQASGRVHTALKKLITIAETDKQILPSWVGPNGSNDEEEKDWDSERECYRLSELANHECDKRLNRSKGPHHGYGKLLAAIRDENGVEGDPIAVGEEREWDAEKEGELILAVNDILLDKNARNIYALPVKSNYLYYKTKVEEEDRLREERDDSFPDKTLNERIHEAYKRRTNTWDKDIAPSGNFMIWYEDNVGAFSVSVTVN
jgi:hypothetical protein